MKDKKLGSERLNVKEMNIDKNPLVSVIIPIYNVEKYLRRCVDSVLNQSYRNLEVWLVDDGSPDDCGKICDEYATKDERIKVIHKTNGGLADARNAALDNVIGDYIVCVDSDDYISPTHIEGLYSLIKENNADVAVNTSCSFIEETEPKPKQGESQVHTYDGLHAVETMFYQEKFDTSAWGKMYKRELFDSVRYPKGLLFEDLPTTYRLMLKANKVAFQDVQSYYYFLRADSIEGAAFSPKKLDSGLQLMAMMDKDRAKLSFIIKSYDCRIVSFSFHLMLQMPKGYKHRKDFETRIKNVRWEVLTDRRARKKARIACLLSYLGGFGIIQKIYNKTKTR